MVNPLHEKEIILELIFAINAKNNDELIQETLPFYVKKLNCLTAFIINEKMNCIFKDAIYPAAFKESLDLRAVKENILKQYLDKYYFCCSKIKSLNYIVFKLENFGYFILVKNQPISSSFLKNLIPVFKFYTNALLNNKAIEEKNKIQAQIDKEIAIQDLLIKMASTYVNIDLKDIDDNIQNSLAEIGTFVNADRTYIFDYDKDLKTSSNTYEWCSKGISAEIDNLQNIPTSEIQDWVKKHKLGEVFAVEDVSKLPEGGLYCLKNILSAQGIKSLITLPLVNNKKLMGFVGFDSVKQIRIYTDKEKKLLQLFADLLVNIKIRKEDQEKLKYQEQKYQSLLESVEVGLIEVDNHFNVEFINEAHTRLFGYTLEEIKGKNAIKHFIPKENQSYISSKLQNLKSSQKLNLEIDALTKNKSIKNILISLGAKNNIYGEKTGVIGAFIDNTKQKKLEKQLINARKLAEVAANEKEKFLANISHEMRTPLNVINGNINEVINYENSVEDNKTLLKQSINASSYLLNLVNNVLDLAKIKAGKVSLNLNYFNLKELCHNTFSILSFLAKKNNNQYYFSFDEELDVNVYSDATKISQVLVNFLTNALKFTTNGDVYFDVECLHKNDDLVDVVFTIKDNGIGIEKKFLKNIFSEFVTEKSGSQYDGTGLGMPISKNIVDLLNGNIDIESKKNIGTKLKLQLKLKIANKLHTSHKQKIKPDMLQNKNILIVEDNHMNALIIKRILERKKATISMASNGLEAIEKLKDKYDLILMDIQMPKMDGITATKKIRTKLKINTPIIAITANVFKADIESYLSKGINDIITKPFTEEKLLKTCKEIFKDRKPNLIHKKENEIKTDYSLKYLNEIAAGDKEFIKELLHTFHLLVKDGLDKVKYACFEKDLDLTKEALHKIKPSVSDLMLYDLLSKIKEVESSNNFFEIEPVIIKIKIALHKLNINLGKE